MAPSWQPRTLLVSCLVGINVLLFALSGFSLRQSQQQYELRAQMLTQNIASAVDQNLSSTIEKIDLALRAVGDEVERQLADKGIDADAANAFLTKSIQRVPEVEGFRVTNADGLVILGNGINKDNQFSVGDRDYFSHHRANVDSTLQISKVLWGRISNHHVIVFSRRYNHPDGRFAGAVFATIAQDHFDTLLSRFDLGPHDIIALRDADLGLIARHPIVPGQPRSMVGSTLVSEEIQRLAASGVRVASYHTANQFDGIERAFSFRRLEGAPMTVFVGLSTKDYLTGWTAEMQKTLAMDFGFLLLSSLLGGFLLTSFSATEREHLRLRTILKTASDGIHILDGNGLLVEANDAFLTMLDYNDSVIGKLRITDWDEATAEEEIRARLDDVMARQGKMVFERRHRRRDGVVLDVEISATAIRIEEKDYFYAASRDITERKTAAVRMENERLRLRTLLETIPDMVWLKDAKGVYLTCNPEFERLFGAAEADIVGKTDYDFVDRQLADFFRQKDREAMAAGKPSVNEERVTYSNDGHRALLETIKTPMLDAAGSLVGILGVARDITRREQAEEEIRTLNQELEQRVADRTAALVAANAELDGVACAMRAAKEEAERANQASTRLFSSASHDLRQPVQALRLFIDLLSADLKGGEHQLKIEMAAKALASAESLLHSLFDMARIQVGAVPPALTDIHIPELFATLTDEFTPLAEAKGVAFRTRSRPLTVHSDPLMLERILRNLIANAVRYTKHGGVLLACRRRDSAVFVEIWDTGPGIAPEHQDAIWEAFYQVDNDARDSNLGLGLGLAIVAKLAERLGFRIEMRSRSSHGTVFRVVIPSPASGHYPVGRAAVLNIAAPAPAG
ncbi:MAG TPA: PAS domain S-box protein [Telmatospirillum sp.]|nr:PAS domain S-box protein [Telmatospirillum sp.]